MSLEQFLTRAPSLDRSIDTKWNIQNAYNLIEYACYTLTVLENDKKKRYTQLYGFLDKKETYLELHKELDVLVNKHNLREWVDNLSDRKDYLEDDAEDDIYYEQNLSHIMNYYKNNLEHADKLVERDLTWKNIYYEYSDDEVDLEDSALEQFLSYRPPSYRKILHPPSVDLEWNIRDAHDLMNHVCHIILAVEKNKRYAELYDFLKKKEIYLALYKELGELMDKYKFEKHAERYAFLEDSDEPYGDQTVLHFHDHLIHADFLVARDNEWRAVLLHEEY